MKKIFIFVLCTFLNTNCVIVDSNKIFSHQQSSSENTPSKQSVAETLNKDTTQFKEFVQIFFADSVYQRRHVFYPLVLYYWAEKDADDDSALERDTILINDNNYQILMLDAICELQIIENEGMEPYVVVSIPDTALEAELYFKKNKGTYLLNQINITGDASPFN